MRSGGGVQRRGLVSTAARGAAMNLSLYKKGKEAASTMRNSVMAMMVKWLGGWMVALANQAPRAEPARPPALKRAWKEDMMGRWIKRSAATAWAFMATSMAPKTTPMVNSSRMKGQPLGAMVNSGSSRA